MFLLVAGEERAVFAFEEFFPAVPVAVMSAQTLHVTGAELTELTGEDGVGSRRSYGTLSRRAGGHVALNARRQLEMTQLLLNVCRLQIPTGL